MRPKFTRFLTLAEVATVLGWTDAKDVVRSARRRLRDLERRTGIPILRRGGGPNNPCTVSWSALRKVGLVDDLGEAVDALRDERDALADDVATLVRAVSMLAKRVSRLEALITATMEIPEVPKCPPLGGRGKGRQDRAEPSRAHWPLPPERLQAMRALTVDPASDPDR